MILKAVARWRRFWFMVEDPRRLGILRIMIFLSILALSLPESLALRLSAYPQGFWKPVGIIRALGLAPLTYGQLQLTELAWKVSLLTSALGLATRLSTAVAAGAGLLLMGLANCFGALSHGHTPAVLVLLVLALSPCGDAFSVDQLLRSQKEGAPAAIRDGRYHWPIQALRSVWCLVFFSAGIAKLRISGPAWIHSSQLANLFLTAPLRYSGAAAGSLFPGLGSELAQYPLLCQLLAFGAVALELLAPVALFSVRGRWILVPMLALAQVLIRLTLFENFVWFLPMYLVWITPPRLTESGRPGS